MLLEEKDTTKWLPCAPRASETFKVFSPEHELFGLTWVILAIEEDAKVWRPQKTLGSDTPQAFFIHNSICGFLMFSWRGMRQEPKYVYNIE